MSEFDQARKHMVDSQIRPSDVTDRRLIAAFLNTPRELFVPRSRRASAYADSQVVTSDNRTLMRPRDMAKLIHAADIQPGDIVLDIANGRGYSTAILACMAETVVGVENDEDGLSRSSTLLSDIGADNAVVVEGAPKAGVPNKATVFTKSSAGIGERVVFDANATVLPGFEAEAGFAF